MQRQAPGWSELKQLIRVRAPDLSRSARVERAATIWDLRRLALKRAPRAVFDYVDGAAETEISLQRSRQAFARAEFRPSVLVDVAEVDTSTTILGETADLPLGLAPTGFTRMMHAAGEVAVARAAGRAGVPYTLATASTTSLDELTRAAPDTNRWFQLYMLRDRGVSLGLMETARQLGCSTLVLTVDTPVAGRRLRDVRNGLTIPPELTLRTLIDGALHPSWWWDLLTTEPLAFAAFANTEGTPGMSDWTFDPSVSVDDVARLKEHWQGPVLVKGVLTPGDAVAVVERGADGVIVSNHGGRQLDRAVTTLEVLPGIVDVVGDRAEVLMDGGIMSGADIAVAVGLGARAAMVGRAYLYGLMAGGEHGVEKALDILRSEFVRTMQLLGLTKVDQLDRSRVKVP